MNPPSSTGDVTLTSAQRETLRVLLGMFVPATADGRVPAAGEMPQVLELIVRLAAQVPAIRAALDMVDAEAMARCGAAFSSLDHARRSMVVEDIRARDPAVLSQLALETVTCYYQQDGVLERLGLEARPPYPKGYQVLAGDLMLLNAVKARGRIYRDAGDDPAPATNG
jgi:hypothetical protein